MTQTQSSGETGWDCEKCGHRHAGRRWANICIGCPCPETAPLGTAAEEDWIRIASQNAKDATARVDRLAAENDKLRAELEIHRAAWTRDGAYEVAVDGDGLEDWELGDTFIVGGKRYVVKSIKRATQPQPTLNIDPYTEAARQMNDPTDWTPLPEPLTSRRNE